MFTGQQKENIFPSWSHQSAQGFPYQSTYGMNKFFESTHFLDVLLK